jgi:hypothetical protein
MPDSHEWRQSSGQIDCRKEGVTGSCQAAKLGLLEGGSTSSVANWVIVLARVRGEVLSNHKYKDSR